MRQCFSYFTLLVVLPRAIKSDFNRLSLSIFSEKISQAPSQPGLLMPQSAAPNPQADAVRLDVATHEAIAACGGDARQAVTALIVANEFLEAQVRELQAAVSNGYARGKFEPVPPDRKDWYD
jgi:hypothetical protein